MNEITVQPLSSFGAEVRGIKLNDKHDQHTIDTLRDIWVEHGVVLFRDQHVQEADLVKFSERFGALEIHVRKEYLSKQHPELLIVSNAQQNGQPLGILADREVGWHHDQIYLERPAIGSLLYGEKIPPSGGNTHFANLAKAYDALSDDKKKQLADLSAIQSYEFFNGNWSEPTNDEQKKRTPDVTHPLVRTHPVSRLKAIYADPSMTPAIVGLGKDESRALLDELFAWCTRREFVYEHEWRQGDAIMWDNAITMHRRDPFDGRHERIMKRTTILPAADLAIPY